ncbi:c-type cytochrome [Bradyrhizobium lablabi]|uniref:c-type cytochrome n=1 Tax=Bradyrhizobium lablabi TaxID=722472 RepID=UPI001BAAD63E|nr:c-type cytochrome [Bradyrhizobium lablabi]MBR0695177.1 c-type cytochrome [Bradyrhizobium lablabi]
MPGVAYGQSSQAPASDPTSAGKAVFAKANCMGCHKWHGNGGGGYGGDALSLRKTELTREQIIETVSCGRPGTGMPFFMRGAYDETKCHGMNRREASAQMPPEGGTFLRTKDVEAVADYVIAHIKGAGEPTYAECVAFFSNTSRVCDIYKTQAQKPEDAAVGAARSQ